MSPFVNSVSSLNLRMGRCEDRELKELIIFTCSVCGHKRKLGNGSSAVMMRIDYSVEGNTYEKLLCDSCADVFVEIVRFGPRVISEAYKWKVSSRIARAAAVHECSTCLKCGSKSESHMFIKYDDLSAPVNKATSCSYNCVRICAKCVFSYLSLLDASKVMHDAFKKGVVRVDVTTIKGVMYV